MTLDAIRMLYDYNWAAHRKVWEECIVPLTENQFKQDLGYSMRSIHGQVVHVMAAEWIWLSRLTGTSPSALFANDDYPNRDAVRVKWDAIEADFRTYLARLTDNALAQTCAFASTKGDPLQEKTRNILLHVVNHGTDHRAQILAMIHQLGGRTLEQDLIFHLRGNF